MGIHVLDRVMDWSMFLAPLSLLDSSLIHFSWSPCSIKPGAVADIPFRWSYRILFSLISWRIASIYSCSDPMEATGIIILCFHSPLWLIWLGEKWTQISSWKIYFTPQGILALNYLIVRARETLVVFRKEVNNQPSASRSVASVVWSELPTSIPGFWEGGLVNWRAYFILTI